MIAMDLRILINTLFNRVPQYIFWKDPASIYLGCNENYARLVGLNSPNDIIGKSDEEIGWLPDGDTAEKFRAGDQAAMSGAAVTNEEEWLSLPNGTKILALLSKVPLLDENQHGDKHVLGVLGVATDITEKKRTEEKIARIQHQMQGMRIISSSISHELRTPLATIKNAVTSIQALLPDLIMGFEAAQTHHLQIPVVPSSHIDLLKTVLNRLDAQIEQANRVMDMLLININGKEKGKLSTMPCSARQCINQALAQYPFPASKPNIIWDDGEDFTFYGHALLIVHVFFNLLKNAIYFIHKAKKGHIHIWIEHAEETNAIHFKDTGLGIPTHNLPHIFEHLFTADTNKGTGVGLAFCNTIMQSYGGSITCHSIYHEYTEFILTFPKP